MIERRDFCRTMLAGIGTSAVTSTGTWSSSLLARPEEQIGKTCTLGYSTYALPNMSASKAAHFIGSLGYDSIELTITADRDVAPEKISGKDRQTLATALSDHGLRVTALMENIRPADSEVRHIADCVRLERACELAKALRPDSPPIIQTVLGQRDWNEVRDLCAKRMEDWLKIAETHEVVIGIKPHRGQAMSRPAEAIGLLKKLGDPPWIRMVFDYSHFIFREMPMDKMIAEALPYTAHIAVKDASNDNGRIHFKLPGEADTIDYAKLLKQFYDGGYRGDVCVEVSSQVWRQENYDPGQSARVCYNNMSRAFADAEIPRPK
jgi:inosose dehydratase